MLGFTLTTALYLCHKLQYFTGPLNGLILPRSIRSISSVAMVKLMFFNKFDIAWEIKYIKLSNYLRRWKTPKAKGSLKGLKQLMSWFLCY